jgi:hypothetical protein
MQKVDPSLLGKVPLSYFLGTLGMPGKGDEEHLCNCARCRAPRRLEPVLQHAKQALASASTGIALPEQQPTMHEPAT